MGATALLLAGGTAATHMRVQLFHKERRQRHRIYMRGLHQNNYINYGRYLVQLNVINWG